MTINNQIALSNRNKFIESLALVQKSQSNTFYAMRAIGTVLDGQEEGLISKFRIIQLSLTPV